MTQNTTIYAISHGKKLLLASRVFVGVFLMIVLTMGAQGTFMPIASAQAQESVLTQQSTSQPQKLLKTSENKTGRQLTNQRIRRAQLSKQKKLVSYQILDQYLIATKRGSILTAEDIDLLALTQANFSGAANELWLLYDAYINQLQHFHSTDTYEESVVRKYTREIYAKQRKVHNAFMEAYNRNLSLSKPLAQRGEIPSREPARQSSTDSNPSLSEKPVQTQAKSNDSDTERLLQ